MFFSATLLTLAQIPKKQAPEAKKGREGHMETFAAILAFFTESAMGLLELVAGFASSVFQRDDCGNTRQKR